MSLFFLLVFLLDNMPYVPRNLDSLAPFVHGCRLVKTHTQDDDGRTESGREEGDQTPNRPGMDMDGA